MNGLTATEISKKLSLKRCGLSKIKKKFPKKVSRKIFETNSRFHAK